MSSISEYDPAAVRLEDDLAKPASFITIVHLLKGKPVGHHTFQKFRKMKPIRQLEVAELMVSANNYGANYAKALLATTKPGDLHRPDELKKATGLSAE